ncbi:transcription factor IIA, alpha/beta subunit [Gloeopeniophorella convolvens]|nr:transcription factor IIA, alpha/beta subunit [Gloeopeniophorella convolvens]
MSNKIVPAIYRSVIDDVILSIKNDFDEYGVSEEVLAELQRKWEAKVIASHVAEFDPPPAQAPAQYPPHMHGMPQHYGAQHPFVPQHPPLPPGLIKKEPLDSRFILSPHYIPPNPTPTLGMPNAARPAMQIPPNTMLTFPAGPSRPPVPVSAPVPAPAGQAAPPKAPAPARIPQVDGPSSSSSEEDSPPPSQQYAPHSSHPSLPQPTQGSAASVDDEAINSDLDDSDSEGEEDPEEGGPGESDIVFCTYDKVARVKNKWKCILKDGMIHINGKDYLFAKCTGEFEW